MKKHRHMWREKWPSLGKNLNKKLKSSDIKTKPQHTQIKEMTTSAVKHTEYGNDWATQMPFLFYWYEHSVYSFLVIAQPQISVLIPLSPPFCPLLLDDFISSWVSTTIYKPGTPRSIFPSRTLLRVYQNSQRGTSDSTYLPLSFPKLPPFVFLFQWTGARCSFIHSLKNPNPKCSCPPPFFVR